MKRILRVQLSELHPSRKFIHRYDVPFVQPEQQGKFVVRYRSLHNVISVVAVMIGDIFIRPSVRPHEQRPFPLKWVLDKVSW